MWSSCLPHIAEGISAPPVTGIASQGQLRLSLLRIALIAVPGVLLLGTMSGVLSGSGDSGWYDGLDKPGFTPPAWVFGAVWPVLYVMQGLALSLVLHAAGARLRRKALVLFALQFALNLLWSPLFFGAHQVRASIYVAAAILGLAAVAAATFFRVRRAAGLLMLPYVAWLFFALALSIGISDRNPELAFAGAQGPSPA